jgi:hypothetical protein
VKQARLGKAEMQKPKPEPMPKAESLKPGSAPPHPSLAPALVSVF